MRKKNKKKKKYIYIYIYRQIDIDIDRQIQIDRYRQILFYSGMAEIEKRNVGWGGQWNDLKEELCPSFCPSQREERVLDGGGGGGW